MIIIKLSGGLERQMFQYALYLKLTSLGREVKFDDIDDIRDEETRPIMLSIFDIDYPSATREEVGKFLDISESMFAKLRRFFGIRKEKIFIEEGFFDSRILNLDNIYIRGKFMSQKYFEDIIPEVKKAYTFPPVEDLRLPRKSNADFLIFYDKIMKTNSVGLHIRRSDSRYNEELYQNICTPEYYAGAIRYILDRDKDATFFVFSNEPKWIKGWVKDMVMSQVTDDMSKEEILAIKDRFVIVNSSNEYTAYLDLFLLSKCKHNILSNSSFSWWGAWMNDRTDKMVLAPNTWINGFDSTHIYTDGMVLINSKGKVDKKVKK